MTSTHAEAPVSVDAPTHPPRWAILSFIVLIALTPAMPHVNVLGGVLDPADLTTIAAAVVGIAGVIKARAWRRLRFRVAPEAYALAAMVPFTLIAAIHAGSLHSVAVGPLRWVLTAVVIGVAYLLIDTRDHGRMLIRAFVVVATFEAAFGLIAYALHWVGPGGNIGISFTGGDIGGLEVHGRITGTTGMASTFIAGYFALTLPAAVGLAMTARGRERVTWVAATVVIYFGLLFTLSRTPIGLATLAIVVLLLAATRPRVWVPVMVLLVALFLTPPVRARMTNVDNDRLALWNAGWRMFRDHWFFGVGPGRYMDFFDAYKNTPYGVATATPHNSVLYVAAESGVLAALALAVAIAFSFRFLRSRNPLVLGPMLGLAAFMIDGMTTNLYEIPSVAIAAWMMAPCVAPYFRHRTAVAATPAPAILPPDGDSATVPDSTVEQTQEPSR